MLAGMRMNEGQGTPFGTARPGRTHGEQHGGRSNAGLAQEAAAAGLRRGLAEARWCHCGRSQVRARMVLKELRLRLARRSQMPRSA